MKQNNTNLVVLILIIMEDTLRDNLSPEDRQSKRGLNPYYNGRYSPSAFLTFTKFSNPQVLILIIMEDTLRENLGVMKDKILTVLILIIMEDTLRDFLNKII